MSDKNDALEALQDARDALREIAQDIGETRRVGIIQDALHAADAEIVRLEKVTRPEAVRNEVPPGYVLVDETLFKTIINQLTPEQGRTVSMYEGLRYFRESTTPQIVDQGDKP